jgi:type 1 fimbriae regulatory protein FimB/type 1 fimbriae regulatory protein FimE
MILMTYRHGLRVTELIGLQWSQVDFDHQVLHVSRLKGSKASTQPLQGDTLRALRKLRRDNPVHPHMLRHACGYKLANAGQDTRAIQGYLGHKNIQHTVRYTELSPNRFKDFWK